MKQLVIFDIDKTIIDGNIYEKVIWHLINKNLLPKSILTGLTKEFLEYKLRIESYEELISDLLQELKRNFDPSKTKNILSEIKKCIHEQKYAIRDFAVEIPKLFPQFEFLVISLEPDFIANEMAKMIAIKNVLSNKIDIKKTKQSFQMDKFEMLQNSEFNQREIFAVFGDSELDYSLMLASRHRIVLNPSSEMKNLIDQDESFKVLEPHEVTNYFKKIAKIS